MNKILLNRLDYLRIQKHINDAKQTKSINAAEAEKLINELNSAKVVEPAEIPKDVVTMNSVVKITFINSNKQLKFAIVYPDQANIKENKIPSYFIYPLSPRITGGRAWGLIAL